MYKVPEQYRRQYPLDSPYYSEPNSLHGIFEIPSIENSKIIFFVVATCGVEQYPWEHVSVSVMSKNTKKSEPRCPTWPEMCYIKSLFWDASDCVIQYHPSEAEYVSFHDYCLHLWRPINQVVPIPPTELIGPVGSGPKGSPIEKIKREWFEENQPLGKLLGYPDCCIKEF